MDYKGKNVLVTGGTGLIGKPLVEMLYAEGANVRIASLDDKSRADPRAEFKKIDLTRYDNCLDVCEGMDYVFHLAGIKGSPKMTKEQPASFFVPTIMFNTNMMEAARSKGIKKYLYTSTVGVYEPTEIFHEEDVWKTFPSENDRFAGWAKRMGELQAQAYEIQHGWKDIAIVRPANVYGPHDNFDPNNAMVIPSLIMRGMNGEDPFTVWGDGSPIRDFIYSTDVARGMLMVLDNCPGPNKPINLGSGTGYTIKNLVEIVVDNLPSNPKIEWDLTKPSGDKKRLMDVSRAKELIGWEPQISLEEGVKKVMIWYEDNKNNLGKRHNVFTEEKII